MLVFSRYVDEQIVIGEGDQKVTVKVLKLSDGRVKLGLTGHPSIPINRKEVYDAKQSNKFATAIGTENEARHARNRRAHGLGAHEGSVPKS